MITFDPQAPAVTEALKQWRSREIFPTEFTSAELRGFSRELMERSVVSACTTNAEYVQEIQNIVDAVLSGEMNLATGRMHLMRKLAQLGYNVEKGFPQDMADVPPAEAGSIRDLSSETRIDLVIETNLRMAANYGRMVSGNSKYALYAYPAWQLVRIYVREIPRGSEESHSVGWQRRWEDAARAVAGEGVANYDAQASTGQGAAPLVALKTSPIWAALGDGAGGYTDTLRNPYPPFAFRSGMGWREVSRNEWERIAGGAAPEQRAMGAGGANERPQFSPGEEEVREVFSRFSPDVQNAIRTALKEELGRAA